MLVVWCRIAATALFFSVISFWLFIQTKRNSQEETVLGIIFLLLILSLIVTVVGIIWSLG